MDEIEARIKSGYFATVSEWIRHAIREQLLRESQSGDSLLESDPRVAQSILQAREGKGKPLDFERLKQKGE